MSCATTRTTCPYCGVGCGVLATRTLDGSVEIKGDPEHPANFGRLCSKGSALGETLSLDDRLLDPRIDGERASWDAALDYVATRFRDTIAAHGPDSVAFYVSGQILTEDYYVANKLMKGFIGAANIDTNSRLCMASSVAGHRRAFGSDTVPGCYEDLEEADLVVLVGSNLAWCHPVLYQRLVAAKEQRGTKVVVIDPRRTATAEIADLHLAVQSGSDVALFNGLLQHVAAAGRLDRGYVWRHTSGLLSAMQAAQSMDRGEIARITGLTQAAISDFYDLFAATQRTVTIYSQGVNQSTAGTDKVNAIINCHLATGRIGRPGMGPFSVTGQPNAMGGREVGGLANMLAAHMDLDNPAHRQIVQTFWEAPRLASKPGLKAVDMFRAVGDGCIKAIWIMATNPVDSMPEADSVRAALQSCPFVVVSDVTAHTDTAALAHVLLPSLAWGEKDGTVTNSERRISRQRAFLPAPGNARSDWWQLAEVGTRMGYGAAFDWAGPHAILAEHAALTAVGNSGTRDLDIGAHASLSREAYDAMLPVQWPQPAGHGAGVVRFFASGGFFTPDRRGRFIATPYRAPVSATSAAYPFILNTGRIRDQWHTMTRTRKAARLMSHFAEPFVEVHPRDAAKLALAPAQLATIESPYGRIIVRVLVTERVLPGNAFVPIHWTDQLASSARVDTLIAGNVDPISGQPELKHTPVRVTRFDAAWYGFAVSTIQPPAVAATYQVTARATNGWRTELAGVAALDHTDVLLRCFLAPSSGDIEPDVLAYHDRAGGSQRFAAFVNNRLVAALFLARAPVAVARGFLVDQLGAQILDAAMRFRLLAGRPGGDTPDRGPIVCACMDVGRTQILNAIVTGGCASLETIGEVTRAGTNCGSCRPEIGALIDAARVAKAS